MSIALDQGTRPIPGTEHYYANANASVFNKNGQLIKPYLRGNHNLYVRVKRPGRKGASEMALRRVIAETFVSNPNNYEYVEHINGNRLDCRASNLRWSQTPPKYSDLPTAPVAPTNYTPTAVGAFDEPVPCFPEAAGTQDAASAITTAEAAFIDLLINVLDTTPEGRKRLNSNIPHFLRIYEILTGEPYEFLRS